ncbi:MAG: universal stress protein [Bryobacterales bacterium]|nr:universal stress protein [Bryobacterales bacterium]
MPLVNHVLFPVDFSERSAAIAPAVSSWVNHFQAKLTVLHAYEWALDGVEDDWSGQAIAQIEARCQARLDAFLPADLPKADRRLVRGKPAHAIATTAREIGADLVMLPTRGETRFRQLLLGSTTASVLHDATCAVWTSAHVESLAVPTGCRSIVCAVDLHDGCAAVLRAARQLAESWKARLAVVHEVIGVDPRFETAISDRAHSWLIRDAQERYPEIARQAGIPQDLEIVEELRLGLGLAKAAQQHQADLLVIGRGAIHTTFGRLWEHTREIVRLSPCPVISV